MKEKICFALNSSLIDLSRSEVPIFQRSSSIWLEKQVNGNYQLYPINTYYPAISLEDGSFTLEPNGRNLISWNTDLTQSLWLKGSNVSILPKQKLGVDGSRYADRVVVASGQGATQDLKRTFFLKPATTYYLSAFIALANGSQAAINDVIKITGDVVGTPAIALSSLNAYTERFRLVEIQFTTSKNIPVIPRYSYGDSLSLVSSTANSITVTLPNGYGTIAANQLVGAQIGFSNVLNKLYNVLSNTAATANQVTITVDSVTLQSDGVTTANNSVPILMAAANAQVLLDFYIESTLSFYFSAAQIEERSYRTSMMFQDDAVSMRSRSFLTYRKSPLTKLKTCGVFLDIKEWRGSGNLFNAGNLKAYIDGNGLLNVISGTTTITSTSTLPSSTKIFIQISQENNTIAVYIDGILLNKTSSNNFIGQDTTFDLTTDLFISYYQIICTDKALLDGQPSIGGTALQEVSTLFTSPVIIDAVDISSNAPLIMLPSISVPARQASTAITKIIAVNSSTNVLTVLNATNFTVGARVYVLRDDINVLGTKIIAISSNQITLDVLGLTLPGDVLVSGNVDFPGLANVRFPFTPKDRQTIVSVDTVNKIIKVGSTLSFSQGRAIAQSPLYQDTQEVIVQSIDNVNSLLYVDDCTYVNVGDNISQPMNEMLIDPPNYFYGFITPVAGVKPVYPYSNGFVILNYNPYPVQVRPYIRVYY